MFSSIGFFLHFLVAVQIIEGYTVLHLDIDESNDNPNSATRIQTKDTQDLINKELIYEIMNTVRKQEFKTNEAIQKCLEARTTKLNKLLCVKNIVDKSKQTARSWYQSDFNNLFNEDSQEIETTSHSNFIDLTRFSEDNKANDRSKLSEDEDFIASARTGDENKAKDSNMLFYNPAYKKHKLPNLNGRRNNNDFILKKILRTNDDSDSDSEDSDSSNDLTRKERKSKRYPKYSDSIEDSDSLESEEVRYKPKKIVKKDPFNYMQAPTRVYEIELDRRRRLPQFLPKRHHWDEDDFKNLGNYWIHGPQGKYPGPYRIPY